MMWQPIETAPKDGTWVLLAGGKVCHEWGPMETDKAVAQYTEELNGRKAEGHWQFAWFDGGYYGWYENPTHWMLLDDLPPLPETNDA